MKFVAKTAAFAEAMASISNIVETRNTYPILANVLLECRDDYLSLRSTDLDIELTMKVPAEVSAPGTTTVPARMLSDILRKLKGVEDVTFSFDGSPNAALAAGRSRFQLAVLQVDSFPTLKTTAFSGSFEIEGKALANIFGTASFAISSEETRYYLNGIHLDPASDGQSITFVATDGHRMARMKVDMQFDGHLPKIIVPKKTVSEISRFAAAAGAEKIKLEISDTKIQMTYGNSILLSKLIEGTFPDYDRVTPKNNNTVAMVEAKLAIAAADRVSTIASDKGGKAVRLNFQPGMLTMSVINSDHGTASDEVMIDYDAEPIEIGFNARYLVEAMNALNAKTIRIAMSSAESPAVLTTESQPGLMIICMPMRV